MTPQCPLSKSPCTHPKCIRQGMCRRSTAGVHKVVVVVDGKDVGEGVEGVEPSMESLRQGIRKYVEGLDGNE